MAVYTVSRRDWPGRVYESGGPIYACASGPELVIVVDASGTPGRVILPVIEDGPELGQMEPITVKRWDGSANAVTVVPGTPLATIDGGASLSLGVAKQAVSLRMMSGGSAVAV